MQTFHEGGNSHTQKKPQGNNLMLKIYADAF